jgi:FkbM family methyltransferase
MFEDKVYVRNDMLDGVDRWYWIKGDNGTWDGPSREWEPLRDKIFGLQPNRRTIIQAGGALGMYPRLWSPHFTRVLTFEPSPLSFHVLTMNCQRNNIFKFNSALSNNHEPLMINCECPDNVGMNRIAANINENSLPVAVVKIDDLDLGDLDVLQLDVEGWEIRVLEGGTETIQRCHPVISLETVDTQIESLLGGWGYVNRGHGGYDQIFEWVSN